MVESIEFCKGIGGDKVAFWLLFSACLLLDKELSKFPKSSLEGAEELPLCPFSDLLKEKKEFKRLKMPNLSILISPKKEKIIKNNCKSLQYRL